MEGRRRHPYSAFETVRRRRRRFVLVAAACAVVAVVAALSLVFVASALVPPPEREPVAEGDAPPPEREEAATAASTTEEAPEEERPEPAAEGEKSIEKAGPAPPPARSCDDLRVLVDREHELPPYYAPADLVSLSAYGVPTLQGTDGTLRREAAVQLARLMAAAAADGQELVVASAYRTYAEQQQTYARYTAMYGEGAGSVSAPPGQSHHQLGTAVDFTNAEAGYDLWWPFGDTSASDWLVANAPDYGYVLAYPRGIEEETGYQYEPWHYRYIGRENVRLMQEADVSLQSYLVAQDVLPRC